MKLARARGWLLAITSSAYAQQCPSGWKQATWTQYESQPDCCYSPLIDSLCASDTCTNEASYDSENGPCEQCRECFLYSACDYAGQFAYTDDKTREEVQQATNIVAFWNSRYAGVYGSPDKIQLRVLDSNGVQIGQDVSMDVLDTCGDSDCGGGCSSNAAPSGNLVDMEVNTFNNVFGSYDLSNLWMEGAPGRGYTLGQICFHLGPPLTTSPPFPPPVVAPSPSSGSTPTTPPISPPTPDNCFSGNVQVDVQGKGAISMDQLQIGDTIKVADGTYSKVYSFSHKQEMAKGEYLRILTDSMMHHNHNPLEITANHLIYVFDESLKNITKLVSAQDVQVGDFLVTGTGLPSRVQSIRMVRGNHGLYTPMTVKGDILVNGVLASSYTSVDCLEGLLSKQLLHWLSHGTMVPHRLYCAIKGSCHDESYDEGGLNPWISVLSTIQDALFDQDDRTIFRMVKKILLVLAGAAPFLFFIILGKFTSTSALTLVAHLAGTAMACFAWKKSNNKETGKTEK